MGLFDKIRRAVEPDDDAYDDYDVEEIYSPNDNNMEDGIPRPSNAQMSNNPYNGGNNPAVQQNNYTGYNNSPQQASNNQGNYQQGTPQPSSNMIPVGSHNVGAVNLSSHEIRVVKAKEDFPSTAGQIAEHLLNRRAVILNLEETTKEMARRLVDFSYGVVFAIGGNSKRVATYTFILTPNNVNISADQLKEDDSGKLGGMDRPLY